MVVESVYRALEVDEDGDSEEVKVVAGALSGKKVTYYEDKEKFVIPDTLRNGDVCLTEINGSHLTNLRVLTNISDHTYDADGNEVYQPPLASGAIYGGDSFVNQELNVFAGPIYGASTTGVVILGWNDNYKLLGTSNNGTNAKAMTIYDRETGKVTVGSRQDIYTNIVPDANEEAQPDDYTPRAVIYRRYDYIVDMIFVK